MTLSTIWKGLAAVSREASTCIELSQLGESHARDFSAAVGCSSHVRIVHHDWNAVGGDMHVELDGISTERDGLSKRFERVLGCVRAIAAMSYYGSRSTVEKNV